MRAARLSIVGSSLIAGALLSCGSVRGAVPDGGTPRETGPVSDESGAPYDAALPDAKSKNLICSPLPDGALAANGNGQAQTLASGTFVGSGVGCSLCNVGAVLVGSTPSGGPSSYTLYLDNPRTIDDVCTVPNGAFGATLSGGLALVDKRPGTYGVDLSATCDAISISFSLPEASKVECGDAMAPNCPAGCEGSCIELDAGTLCSVCEPPGTVSYAAGSPCAGLPSEGSWSVTLTSADLVPGDAGAGTVEYRVHGSVDAVLVGGGSDSGSAKVSLTF